MSRPFLVALAFIFSMHVATAQVTFSSASFPSGGSDTFSVTGDFNGDGIPDLALADFSGSVAILLGHSDGSYVLLDRYPVGHEPSQIVTGDLNNDGKLDLITAEGDNQVILLLGNGDGTFSNGTSLLVDHGTTGVALFDANGDHVPDIAVNDCEQVQDAFCQVDILLNDGHGNFTRKPTLTNLTFSPIVPNPLVADFNHDGRADLAVLQQTAFKIFLGNGDGTFKAPITVTLPDGQYVDGGAVGSFNHDTYPDLALRAACGTTCSGKTAVKIFQNDGTGHFGLRSRFLMGTVNAFGQTEAPITVGDINGDEIQDAITIDGETDGSVRYALGHGDGTFAAPVTATKIAAGSWITLRDLNRDSRQDMVVTDGLDNSVHVLRNTNAQANCAPPSAASLSAKICSPATGATVNNTFTVSASGNSPAGTQRLELWIDGAKRFEILGDQLRRSVNLAAGSHRITVIAVSSFGKSASKSSVVSVH